METMPSIATPNLPAMTQPGGSDIAVQAAAAQAKAMIESRYVMAMHNPRNWDDVRQKLLKECRRPSFANNKSTFYKKPIGKGVEGLGIRFVEVALRCMTNVLIETTTVYDDDDKEIIRVMVTDLESNISYPMDLRITKTVERSKPLDDGSFISVRKNSYGKDVYTIPATDDDLLNKRGAAISKAMRTLGLRIIPGDLQDEAEEIIKSIRLNKASEDPDTERKRIIDAFSELGVLASDLIEYLGHDIAQCSPAELVDLRGLYGAIRDGETSWSAVMANKEAEDGDDGGADTGSLNAELQQSASKKKAAKPKSASKPKAQSKPKDTEQTEPPPASSNGSQAPTYAEIADKINKATNSDEVNEAIDLTNMVPDLKQREELIHLAEEKLNTFTDPAQ